jgi:DNA repair protein RadC
MARSLLVRPGMDAEECAGPRERALFAGIDALSDAELLAILLGTGRKGEGVDVLSAAMLADLGGLDGVARTPIGGLVTRPGVGPAKAARVAAGLELGRRATAPSAPRRVKNGGDVMRWARGRLANLEHEELWILILDGSNALRAARRVAMGGLHGVHVHARDVLRWALREGASAFVLVHNHPSGDPTPSPEDFDFTERVLAAANVVGTALVDHVVVSRAGHRSLASFMALGPG